MRIFSLFSLEFVLGLCNWQWDTDFVVHAGLLRPRARCFLSLSRQFGQRCWAALTEATLNQLRTFALGNDGCDQAAGVGVLAGNGRSRTGRCSLGKKAGHPSP